MSAVPWEQVNQCGTGSPSVVFGAPLPGGLVWRAAPALGFGLCLEHGHPHSMCVDNCPQPLSVDVNPSALLASPSGSPSFTQHHPLCAAPTLWPSGP